MLNDTKLRGLKPKAKLYRVADSGGLCVEVPTNGTKLWRFRYRYQGRAKMLSLGRYPEVTLAEARTKRDEARKLLSGGTDPAAARKAERAAHSELFREVAEEWYKKRKPKLAPATQTRARAILENDLIPWLGNRPIAELDAPDVLAALRRMESRGAVETAHRARQYCSAIFRYGVACGYCRQDVAAGLRDALEPIQTTNRAAITEEGAIGALLRAIDGYTGQYVTRCALKLLPLVFVRPAELRKAEWREIDLNEAVWIIPPERMKMKREHRVPLAPQAVAILSELRQLTGPDGLVFPSVRSASRPLSENTLNAALRRLGYSKEEMCAHGFRSLASTRLHELGYPPHVIEAQLAHVQRNTVAAVYNRAEYWPERVKMMGEWARYLDGLRAGGKVVAIGRKQA